MNKIFRRILKNYTKGDEENELYLWNFFYNYEVSIGIAIAVVLCLIAFLVIGPFAGINVGYSKIFNVGSLLAAIGIPLLFGLFFAYYIVSPLLDKNNIRKGNVKQGSLFLATAIGHIANFIVNWAPLLLLVMAIMTFNWILIVGACVGILLYYLILGWVKSNAKDYVNWRFNWAIENYEKLFSGHYKWWTSAADMSVQKINLKKFQNYKYHATLSLIMIPLMGSIFILSFETVAKDSVKKTEQVQVTTDSITSPDVVENNAITDPEEVIENQENEQSAIMSENEDTYSETSTSTGDENSIQSVVVTGVNVRLRTSPEINDYNIIKDSNGKNLHPNKGERLECIGEDGDFYLVNFRGNNVYISKQFVVIQ